MGRKIYLRSYDIHAEMLEYDVEDGSFRLLARTDVEQRGLPRTMGMYTKEEEHVFGVYATPDGPVFFRDSERIAGSFGRTQALVELDSQTNIHRFALFMDGQPAISTHYRDRGGIGANPYDTEREDVDMFAALAKATERPQFFENYRKVWVS